MTRARLSPAPRARSILLQLIPNMSDEVSTGSGSDLVKLIISSTLLVTGPRLLPLTALTPLRLHKLGHDAPPGLQKLFLAMPC